MYQPTAVLFDWSGTLAYDPSLADRFTWAAAQLGRDNVDVDTAVESVTAAAAEPRVAEALADQDTSPRRHRSAKRLLFDRAGIDEDLAEAVYRFDFVATNRPLYPEVSEVLNTLREAGVRIAIVSDIHFDLRGHLAEQGVADLVDGWALSCELGVVKPHPRMFTTALDALGTAPESAVMIGDSVEHDGGAQAVGIPTLILPRPQGFVPRGLHLVTRLFGLGGDRR